MAAQFIARILLCASERALRPTRTGAVSPRTEPLISMNRRVRIRTNGGVGREGAASLLPILINASWIKCWTTNVVR